ncbi:MAG: succinate dehydrogenase / fumarate reductase flavoprotein subunit [Candidatus Woesearchaeota archaeon]|jgi:succinate dehydrogenase / fumarate reductase flavoprotein subunit
MKLKHIQTDVLIIGSGGAGLRCAIELHDNKVDFRVVGKCKKRDAHTILATGGINAALGTMDKQDSWQLHATDTIKDGGGINNPRMVEILCKNAPTVVKELNKWKVGFHKESSGKITQRFFGAATYRRACFIGDQTGKAILNTLVDQVLKRKIQFDSEIYIFSLLQHNGCVNGALGLEVRTGKIIVYHCKKIVLATGGHSRMFARSSSRFWENNGDGIYLSQECGAQFMDMEMFQFHPTGMVHPKNMLGTLVTEAVRGEGGILTNGHGERFMKNYDAARMELSARDIVARANYLEVVSGRGTKHGGVYLDISHLSKSYILKRLPLMYRQFKKVGIDITKQKMEVAPTAHYSMGGLVVDPKSGKTTVPNMYAIGEVTSGTHGGNRLGGNSLAEILVFGQLVGKQVISDINRAKLLPLDHDLVLDKCGKLVSLSGKGKNPITIKKEIQEIMWKGAGVVRCEKDMLKTLKKLLSYKKCVLGVTSGLKMNEKLIAALDVRNMIPTCEMILHCAMKRKESRAAHTRSDYPKTKKSWKKNIFCEISKTGVKTWTNPVLEPSKQIAKLLTEKDVKYHRLE